MLKLFPLAQAKSEMKIVGFSNGHKNVPYQLVNFSGALPKGALVYTCACDL